MNNLLVAFQQMQRNDWDYYLDGNIIENPFLNQAQNTYHEFINLYFSSSGKRLLQQEFESMAVLNLERASHTVSIFFLGILIWKNTKLFSLLYGNETNPRENPTFQFVWFLSILFHDYAEELENDKASLKIYEDIDSVILNLKIKHNLLEHPIIKENHKTLFTNVRKYFAFRRFSMKVVDHGIFAGLFFYDRLVSLRRKKAIDEKSENDNGLHWHESLEDHYATAAAAICCHNIWTIQKDRPYHSNYVKFELHDLIQPKFKKINPSQYPLLFLFGLVDTIDPVKYFERKGHSVSDALSKINMKFEESQIRIYNIDLPQPLFEKYNNDMKDNFKGWLELEVSPISNNSFCINF